MTILTLRKVTMEDAKDLLSWKNDVETRINSIVTNRAIKMAYHLIWLKKTLNNKKIDFWIIDYDGHSMGDLRLNHGRVETEVSIRLDATVRGAGVATSALKLIPKQKKPLMAKIVAHNIASMRAFIKNGFLPSEYVKGKVNYYIFRK